MRRCWKALGSYKYVWRCTSEWWRFDRVAAASKACFRAIKRCREVRGRTHAVRTALRAAAATSNRSFSVASRLFPYKPRTTAWFNLLEIQLVCRPARPVTRAGLRPV
jgi:hypothetical protein